MRWNRFIVSALLPLSRSSPPFFPCSFSLSVALSLSRTCNVNLCYFAQSSVTLLNLQHLELKLLHRHLPLHDDPLGVTGKEKQRGSNIFLQCNTVLFGKDTRFLRKSETLSLTKIQKIMRKDELKFSEEQVFVVVCYLAWPQWGSPNPSSTFASVKRQLQTAFVVKPLRPCIGKSGAMYKNKTKNRMSETTCEPNPQLPTRRNGQKSWQHKEQKKKQNKIKKRSKELTAKRAKEKSKKN